MKTENFFEKVEKDFFKKYLNDTVLKAQHCQRNWDLGYTIPEDDINLMIHAATQCPSKQNMDFYELYVIQNREIQEKIYESSITTSGRRKNPQLLANALFVFVEATPTKYRNPESKAVWQNQNASLNEWKSMVKAQYQAVGIAAGFLNMVSTSMGYNTGCNTCHDGALIAELLGTGERMPLLAMGIGMKDTDRNRREEMVTGQMVETFQKCPINVVRV